MVIYAVKWVKTGKRGIKVAQRRRTSEQEQEKKSDGWALSRPTNGLLATLSGKGWPKRPFHGASSTQCSALSDFSTRLEHFGSFWGHFGVIWRLWSRNLLSRKSPKYCSNDPLGPMGGPKWPKPQNLTPGAVQCILDQFWRGRILVDLCGLQTPSLMLGTRPTL